MPLTVSKSSPADSDDPSVSPEELLELLDDEYTLAILDALRGSPQPARELVEACDGSRPTVYRRLNRLEEAGLVDSQTSLHPDGHHRKKFNTDVSAVTIELGEGGFSAAVTEGPTSAGAGIRSTGD